MRFADNRSRYVSTASLQLMINKNPRMIAQRKNVERVLANTVQAKADTNVIQRIEYWTADQWGASNADHPGFANGGTAFWEGPHAGGNHLYAHKSAAYQAAFNNLGIQDMSAMNFCWKLKQGNGTLTMFPDATNNETRVIANHTNDATETLDRVFGHHGNETARNHHTTIDHYHAGNYAGQVIYRGQLPGAGWAHVVMPHFYVCP